MWCTHQTSLVRGGEEREKTFQFSVAAKNSIKVGPLVFLL